MPASEVMPKFQKHELHSGSKHGPLVTNPKQAVAIEYSEKGEARRGKKEYQEHRHAQAHHHLSHAHDHLQEAMKHIGGGDGY